MLRACAIASAFFCGFLAPIAAALDLSAAEKPTRYDRFAVRDTEAGPILVTGLVTLGGDPESQLHLAVSPVNVASVPATPASRALFGAATRRPATWSEATAACSTYHAAGKTWTLPTVLNAKRLNQELKYGEAVLSAETGELATLAGDYRALQAIFSDQFSFFWTADADPKLGPGLKIAAYFGPEGKSQSLSTARPLNVICVTQLTAPRTTTDVGH